LKKIDGKAVANAARPLRLNVTAEDIREGQPLNHNSCAIALAAKRQVPGVRNVMVHLGTIYIEIVNRGWLRWHVPEYATREVVAFDRGGKFVPCEIDFTPLTTAALVRKVGRIRGSSSPSSKRRKPKIARHYTEGVRGPAYANEPPAPATTKPRRK
jgi:hypothetical protein